MNRPDLNWEVRGVATPRGSALADHQSPQEGTRWPVRNVVNASAVTSYFAAILCQQVNEVVLARGGEFDLAKPGGAFQANA